MLNMAEDKVRPVRMGQMRAETIRRDDGSILIRSLEALDAHPATMTDRLDEVAAEAPDRILFADRNASEGWRTITYAQARQKALAVGEFLLGQDLSPDRPIAILSGNDVDHAILALGAYYAGIPYVPVSPAYSLVSRDHAKLKYVFELLTPGLVFVADAAPFAGALADIMKPGMKVLAVRNPPAEYDSISFDEALTTAPTAAIEAASAKVTPDTITKFLLTSGSTGMPKAVINTQRMTTCNQQMIRQALAFLADEPPVLVDWLPWNHTAGGNHNFGIALYNGGSLYIDDGAPTETGILKTVRNLEDIAPTFYSNVPKGYEALVEHLKTNDKLRQNFFSRLKVMQYAGAGLARHVWDDLDDLARQTVGQRVMMITGYGSTETAPFAFTTTWVVDRPGQIGLPAAGLEVKLVPNADKQELRLKGPSITPGYWRQPGKTEESFDEEGFYKIGDAVKFADENDVNRGLLFDGRVSEDFKLSTGTWVNMAGVRSGLITACAPLVRDAVLTGLDQGYIGALIFPDLDNCRRLVNRPGATPAEIAADPAICAEFQKRLDELLAKSTGSSTRVARAIILDSEPSIDKSEVTDKGSLNQRAVMAARPEKVADIYTDPPPSHVIVAKKPGK